MTRKTDEEISRELEGSKCPVGEMLFIAEIPEQLYFDVCGMVAGHFLSHLQIKLLARALEVFADVLYPTEGSEIQTSEGVKK